MLHAWGEKLKCYNYITQAHIKGQGSSPHLHTSREEQPSQCETLCSGIDHTHSNSGETGNGNSHWGRTYDASDEATPILHVLYNDKGKG